MPQKLTGFIVKTVKQRNTSYRVLCRRQMVSEQTSHSLNIALLRKRAGLNNAKGNSRGALRSATIQRNDVRAARTPHDVELQSRAVLCKTTSVYVRAGFLWARSETVRQPGRLLEIGSRGKQVVLQAWLAAKLETPLGRMRTRVLWCRSCQDKVRLPSKCCRLVPWFQLKFC